MGSKSIIKTKEKNILYVLLIIGLLGTVGGLLSSDRFWAVFLQNSFYFLTIA